MAPKAKNIYVCKNCGYESPKWYGRCPECLEWNTFEEQVVRASSSTQKTAAIRSTGVGEVYRLDQIDQSMESRYHTGIQELDRVLGGGIVKGSLVLLGGDPGIGKSTLLLQMCEELGKTLSILYVSGEESAHQIKLRAQRLGVHTGNLSIAPITDIETVVDTIAATKPDIVMVDSIQTMNLASVSSSSGSITQVRECTSLLMRTAKELDIPIWIVGHVNKDGAIAGPKVLEHIVDAVLYFEGERHLSYRILRAVKNRYGSTNEIGIFEMGSQGLAQVESPSQMLLSGRPENVSGTCVACVMEGSRPILVEVQALVSKTGFSSPRRTSTGFDYNRTLLLIAVLEKRAGCFFGTLDTYINIVGGLRLDEPAADLAVCVALLSGITNKPVDEKTVVFGEVGLAGEVRGVSNAQMRIREAERLGFEKCVLPKANLKNIDAGQYGIELIGIQNVNEAFGYLKAQAH